MRQILRARLDRKVTRSDGKTVTVREHIADRGIKYIAEGRAKQWPQTFAWLDQFDSKQTYVPTPDDEERLSRLLTELSDDDGDNDEEE